MSPPRSSQEPFLTGMLAYTSTWVGLCAKATASEALPFSLLLLDPTEAGTQPVVPVVLEMTVVLEPANDDARVDAET